MKYAQQKLFHERALPFGPHSDFSHGFKWCVDETGKCRPRRTGVPGSQYPRPNHASYYLYFRNPCSLAQLGRLVLQLNSGFQA